MFEALTFEIRTCPVDVDVAIVGAGIGGLALASALRRVGIDAHVFERTRELSEVGGAIVLRESSVKLFASWKILGSFFSDAVRVDVLDVRDSRGRSRGTRPIGLGGDGAAYSIHRADLQRLLIGGVDAEHIHFGMECTSVSDDAYRAVVAFANGSTCRAKVLVGADGITSVVRRLIANDEPIFGKAVVLRAIAPATALPRRLPNDRAYTWGDEPRMMTVLPLRGGREVSMDTIMSREEAPPDLWTSEVPRSELLNFFDGFDPALLAIIAAGVAPVRANPVYDRYPLERWSVSRTTLLGDAAHAGANAAIHDAGALAAALAEAGLSAPARAFARYEKARFSLTKEMQRG